VIAPASGSATTIADMAIPADIDATVAQTIERFGPINVPHNDAFTVMERARIPCTPQLADGGGVAVAGLSIPGAGRETARPHVRASNSVDETTFAYLHHSGIVH